MNRTVVVNYFIRACPECKNPFRIPVENGVAFGARSWSDNVVEYPFRPSPPSVFFCKSCNILVHIDDVIDPHVTSDDLPTILRNTDWIEQATELQIHNYLRHYRPSIARKMATETASEDMIRCIAWQLGNDQYRTGKPDETVSNIVRRNNMFRLLELERNRTCKGCPHCQCQRIELLRNLGEFTKAIVECSKSSCPNVEPFALFEQTLCERGLTETANINAVRYGPGCV